MTCGAAKKKKIVVRRVLILIDSRKPEFKS